MIWTDRCSVGIPELEEQHKRVFERFVLLKEIVAKGGGWNDLHSALATLIKDAEFCSALEEALMRIHDYQERERHTKEHGDLMRSLHAMEKTALTTGLTEEMMGTAFAATVKHHRTQDRRHARYLQRAIRSMTSAVGKSITQ